MEWGASLVTGVSGVGSILMADIGSVATKLALFDMVDGRYRFVAGGRAVTATHPSLADVGCGVRQASQQVELAIGRPLFGDAGLISPESVEGVGVDLFGVAGSCRGPLRILALGAMDEASLRSLLVGALDASVQLIGSLSWQVHSNREQTYLGPILDSLSRLQPEALLLIDGVNCDSRAAVSELAQALVAIRSSVDGPMMPIVYAGERGSAEVLKEVLRGKYDCRCVDSLYGETAAESRRGLAREMSDIWVQSMVGSVPGFARVRPWMLMSPVYAPQALSMVTRFLAGHYRNEVWCVDAGASTTCVFAASRSGFLPIVREGLGVGTGADGLLASAERIGQWLPFDLSVATIGDALMNKRLRPWSIPQTVDSLLFEAALAREAVQRALGNSESRNNEAPEGLARPMLMGGLVVGCGAAIAQAPTDGLSALNLLDALEPAGIGELAIDRFSILPQLGALGASYPGPATQALISSSLYRLGTYLAPDGLVGQSTNAVTIVMERSGGKRQEVTVPFGSIQTIPLGGDEEANLEVRPHKKLDIGAGHGRSLSLKVRGGSLGIIVDARGRPISVPGKPTDRSARFQQWRSSVGG